MPQASGSFAFEFNAGPIVSIFAHAIILALLIFGLPRLPLDVQEPPAIEVELAAPEPEKPKQETPKPQPKPVQQAPKPQAKAEPAPKPKTDSSQTDPADQAKPKPPAMMRPVLKFGEKDAGTIKPADGRAEAAPKPEMKSSDTQAAEKQVAPPQPSTPAPTSPPDPQGITAPARTPPAETKAASLPEPQHAQKNAAGQPRSQSGPQDQTAMTAMGDLPRANRAGQLCVTELRRRLNNSNPPYWPDLLPAYRLANGNVLQVRKGAFRANGRWYNLGFKCEVDADATTVVSLSFEVGAPVPRSEWGSRGFPPM